ncbi:MAG TPA: hypothetical protein PLB12_13020, partial [Candidatus Goldiibacteriota bacterium]|nr:hypothetical protein [Candidatus Goldiibacteriota bacterium]
AVYGTGLVPGDIEWYDMYTDTIYDPNLYELTTQDGTKYVISQSDGLISMEDLNGNKLTIDANGIHHTSGKDISFTRDAEGRITRITAPDSKYISYGYDANGDLVEFKDRVQTADSTKGKSEYGYNETHGMTSIKDPRGITPIRNEYDESGRLVKHIDAFGKEIVYTHNMAANTESVTNRMNKTVSYVYDERGNVTSMTDAMGQVTTYTYDSYDNKLTETTGGHTTRYEYADPASQLMTAQIDALSNKTEYTYDANGRVLTTKDPKGNITTNTYDTKGNLLTTQDAKSNQTHYDYYVNGAVRSMLDAENNRTDYTYDAQGNMLTQTQCGVTTTYTYDTSGNRVTETRPQNSGVNILTQFNYDAEGRNTKTIYADNTDTETIYDSLGKAVAR